MNVCVPLETQQIGYVNSFLVFCICGAAERCILPCMVRSIRQHHDWSRFFSQLNRSSRTVAETFTRVFLSDMGSCNCLWHIGIRYILPRSRSMHRPLKEWVEMPIETTRQIGP